MDQQKGRIALSHPPYIKNTYQAKFTVVGCSPYFSNPLLSFHSLQLLKSSCCTSKIQIHLQSDLRIRSWGSRGNSFAPSWQELSTTVDSPGSSKLQNLLLLLLLDIMLLSLAKYYYEYSKSAMFI